MRVHTPLSSRYLVGSLLGSACGGLLLALAFYFAENSKNSGLTQGVASAFAFVVPAMFVIFVLGVPSCASQLLRWTSAVTCGAAIQAAEVEWIPGAH